METWLAMSLRTTSARTTAPTAPATAAAALDAPRRTYTPDYRYVLLLGMMCALPAVSTDIYLPGSS
jgi:DHA1 family bicyclomycin/chloramphenicol resistance-like MFS transporter